MGNRNFNIEIKDGNKFIEDLVTKKFTTIDGEYIWDLGFDTLPHCTVNKPKNYPNCCDFHKSIKENAIKKFEKFPHCCDFHRKLVKKDWFKKELYNHVPEKIVKQWIFLECFMDEHIEKDDWYREITDYFDYVFDSFGTPTVGISDFIGHMYHYLKNNHFKENFPLWKRKLLIEFINESLNVKKNTEIKAKTDINILHGTYQKWVKALPSVIKEKEKLEQIFPLGVLIHSPHYNRFTQLTKYKTRTNGEFIEILINTTKSFLLQIDSTKVADAQKHQLEIINESHRIKQVSLLQTYSKKEMKYIKILNIWLKNEKDYFHELNSVLHPLPMVTNNISVKNEGNENIINLGDNAVIQIQAKP
ncbi:hypothetical protein ACI6PS_07490 [Flavobacterium sp. PLA-1-15]|uniref:hypothetical protein n=1 Tax=Flavobacterium sp. PLA-1-15 TaxID=3380533 RepID=UPI003B75D780